MDECLYARGDAQEVFVCVYGYMCGTWMQAGVCMRVHEDKRVYGYECVDEGASVRACVVQEKEKKTNRRTKEGRKKRRPKRKRPKAQKDAKTNKQRRQRFWGGVLVQKSKRNTKG